jgi:hypothetical protein
MLFAATPARAEEEPRTWEQLFFPFPIVGAPPQLEQQVQIFEGGFTGKYGAADQLSAEISYIASPHLGFVLTVPYQIGISGQPTGFGDLQLLAQYLAAGSLRFDDMVSLGLQGTVPTAQHGLGSGDLFFGPFVYAAQRFFHHVVFELNATGLLPVIHGDSARQVLVTGLLSVLLDSVHAPVPVYAQLEANTTFYLGGTSGLPPLATHTPTETVFVSPEIFLGPFRTPVSAGTRIAAGVSFNLLGDPVHKQIYTVTAAFDLPNPYGY